MHQKPRRTLVKIVEEFGDELIHDPRRTEALLNDLCGQYTREIFVLVQAQRRHVPAELRAAPKWIPIGTTVNRLTQMLETQLALTPEAAAWAVDSWALALGVLEEPAQAPWFRRIPNRLWGPGRSESQPAAPNQAAPTPPTRRRSRLKRTGQNATTVVQSSPEPARPSAPARTPKSNPAGTTGLTSNRKHRSLGGFPAYLRKQAPNAILWTMVLLTSLLLGWAVWDGGALSDALTAVGEPLTAPTTALTTAEHNRPPATQTPNHLVLMTLYAPPQAAVATAADGLNVRAGPSIDATALGLLQAGQSVRVIGFSPDGQWAELNAPYPGWVSTDFLAFSTANGREVRITLRSGRVQPQLDAVALHLEPSAGAPSRNEIQGGTEITVIAATLDNNWLHIGAPLTGWLMAGAVELFPAEPGSAPSAVGLQP